MLYNNYILIYLPESQPITLNARTNKLTNSQLGSTSRGFFMLFLKILCKIEDLFLTLQPIKWIDETGIIPSYIYRTGPDDGLLEA